MKYMHNPMTGEVKLATPLLAKKLQRYGWKPTTFEHWKERQTASVQRALQKAGITKQKLH